MRIVNREEFLSLPEYTLFCKYEPIVFSDLRVKLSTIDNKDFNYAPLFNIAADTGENFVNTVYAMEDRGLCVKLEGDAPYRDGLFDLKQKFAVFDNDDVRTIISLLTKCIK